MQFEAFAHHQTALRDAITAAYRRDERECVQALLAQAAMSPEQVKSVQQLASRLVTEVRRERTRSSGVDALMHEFSLDSSEGIALMCLAEALLRIPDRVTADKLIRDKISRGDWKAHLGNSSSLFVNAAAWGLLVTGKLVSSHSASGLSAAMTRLIAKGGEPLIRKGVDMAMRMLGKQFVTGETIGEALANGREREARGYRFSYDMLGEAAMTEADAQRYLKDYVTAIHAIGKESNGRGIYEGPGISVKLSAIHPRYARLKHERMMSELLPRLKDLFLLAKQYNIGLNIDAEEADRLEISMDLVEALANDPDLNGFEGIGIVVQAYQKRCPYVIDFLIDLARRTSHRFMVRLVKGAYWDAEIKRAQVDGLPGYPVYTRKVYTDVSYLACAKKLLAAQDAIYPQFATHNAYSLAAIYDLATGLDYEFQCLHGMGETLYDQVVGKDKLGKACRIYAPVGSHETLLAYLVRRLLENGANSSFVNRIVDEAVSIAELVTDPVAEAARHAGAPHGKIALPAELYGNGRRNSKGLDLSSEHVLATLQLGLQASEQQRWAAFPMLGDGDVSDGQLLEVRNPANHADIVGKVIEASPADVERALTQSAGYAAAWAATPVAERAACLNRMADLMEANMPALMGLAVREAGKTLNNAIAEVREAVDFCRYYAAQIAAEFDNASHQPLGPVVCISPWNFPLAIFIGDARIQGVIFTGSTEVAQIINRTLAKRSDDTVLVAETGGMNAMIVDSSALPEQVVTDVLSSAFDSAGQRCSALRVLYLQHDIADKVVKMIKGAMDELTVGNPAKLTTDVGPVIDAEAQAGLLAHIEKMKKSARAVHQTRLSSECEQGTYVAPTLFEIDNLSELKREVFGPVLHVLRFAASDLDQVVAEINATGYGLTHGIHSRIDETIADICGKIKAGNVYVNRNIVGAVVGVQPFGGEGKSGTGPKAGGPYYLYRLSRAAWQPKLAAVNAAVELPALEALAAAAKAQGLALDGAIAAARKESPLAHSVALPGPTGENNTLGFAGRGRIGCVADDAQALAEQLAAVFAAGNRAVLAKDGAGAKLAAQLGSHVELAADVLAADVDAVLFAGSGAEEARRRLAARDGALAQLILRDAHGYNIHRLVVERALSVNTTAAGGNASLMSMSE